MDKKWWYVIVLVVIIILLMLVFRDSVGISPRNKPGTEISSSEPGSVEDFLDQLKEKQTGKVNIRDLGKITEKFGGGG